MKLKLAVILLMLAGLYSSEAARILAIMSVASPSHYIFNRPLLVALAARGHQVTVLGSVQEKHPMPNLTHILMEDIYKDGHLEYENPDKFGFWDMIAEMSNWGTRMCERQISTKGAQQLLNYPSDVKFDLIISEVAWGECFFGLFQKFGSPPVVATSAVGIPPWLSLTMAHPENPSFIPNFLLSYTDHMSFMERVYNLFMYTVVMYFYGCRMLPSQQELAAKHFKEDLPPFMDIAGNFSVVLVNTNLALDVPRPLLPNVIPIGGMHIKTKPEPLRKDLQKFLDEANDGFIFFSLGTNLRSDSLPKQKKEAILQAFSELPQRVLWKFETENLEGLPPNVIISKWLPQSDILAHPNIRLFITHCGMMSTMEAAYWGVPVVGISFFLDQHVNLRKLVGRGGGVPLDITTLDKESLLHAVRTVLNNDSYRVAMKKLAALYRDEPQSALDRAVFWTEYVLRHNGAPHLRAASAELSWYQYLLLDVLLMIALIPLLVFIALRIAYRVLVRAPKKLKTK